MPTLHATTFIAAPAEIVFDISTQLQLQKEPVSEVLPAKADSEPDAQAALRETEMLKYRFLMKTRILQLKVTEIRKPELLVKEQWRGEFRKFRHEQYFKSCANGTILIHLLHYETYRGLPGKCFNFFYFNSYVKKWIDQQLLLIKRFSEKSAAEILREV
ncbi:MAG: hypothetical protein N2747_04875 [Chitinophagaceae bacterium]|nr:hypothetical protein [Chitinophagaceae bacterium]